MKLYLSCVAAFDSGSLYLVPTLSKACEWPVWLVTSE
jgi:hypothetical protein